MRRIVLIAAAAAVAFAAHAEERRKVSPLAIYGSWLGSTGGFPKSCQDDGFVVYLGAVDDKSFRMTVSPRTGGVKGAEVITDYKVLPPPETAPLRLEIFLTSEKGDIAFDHLGSRLEIVPAGADKAFATTSLYLARCAG